MKLLTNNYRNEKELESFCASMFLECINRSQMLLFISFHSTCSDNCTRAVLQVLAAVIYLNKDEDKHNKCIIYKF